MTLFNQLLLCLTSNIGLTVSLLLEILNSTSRNIRGRKHGPSPTSNSGGPFPQFALSLRQCMEFQTRLTPLKETVPLLASPRRRLKSITEHRLVSSSLLLLPSINMRVFITRPKMTYATAFSVQVYGF